MTATTHDAFLDGRLTLEQPAKGYRAGVDPVLLAASAPVKAGQSVLDLGCGVGAALLCLAARVPDITLHGIDIQSDYAELCRRNVAANGLSAKIWTADIQTPPADLRTLTFDHIIANPPYFDRTKGNASPQPDRDIAFAGATDMSVWIDVATRRLAPKGWLTIIQKADRLPDVLGAMDRRLGSISVVPVSGRIGRDADRFLMRARKGGRAAFRLHAPVHLHDGATHGKDGEDYRADIVVVLRNGAEFPFPD